MIGVSQAREIRLNAEDEISPLIIVSDLATTDEGRFLIRGRGPVPPEIFIGETRLLLRDTGIHTNVETGPITGRRGRHWCYVFFRRNGSGICKNAAGTN